MLQGWKTQLAGLHLRSSEHRSRCNACHNCSCLPSAYRLPLPCKAATHMLNADGRSACRRRLVRRTHGDVQRKRAGVQRKKGEAHCGPASSAISLSLASVNSEGSCFMYLTRTDCRQAAAGAAESEAVEFQPACFGTKLPGQGRCSARSCLHCTAAGLLGAPQLQHATPGMPGSTLLHSCADRTHSQHPSTANTAWQGPSQSAQDGSARPCAPATSQLTCCHSRYSRSHSGSSGMITGSRSKTTAPSSLPLAAAVACRVQAGGASRLGRQAAAGGGRQRRQLL